MDIYGHLLKSRKPEAAVKLISSTKLHRLEGVRDSMVKIINLINVK